MAKKSRKKSQDSRCHRGGSGRKVARN